jgi:hypothetical protein
LGRGGDELLLAKLRSIAVTFLIPDEPAGSNLLYVKIYSSAASNIGHTQSVVGYIML